MLFSHIHPELRTVEITELLSAAALDARARADLPYTVANFVASADGHATLRGRSRGLGDNGDRAVFHALREHADAILVGTRTLAGEGYGRLIPDGERRERRVARGRPSEPLACLISRSGELPREIGLMTEPASRVIVFCEREPDLAGVRAEIEVVRFGRGELSARQALEHLRREHGIGMLLCEGGPSLLGVLARDSLLDELFLTVAPKLTGGGTGPGVTTGPELAEPAAMALEWVLEREGSLYLRYRLRR